MSSFKSADATLPYSDYDRTRLDDVTVDSSTQMVEGKRINVRSILTGGPGDCRVLVDNDGWVVVSFDIEGSDQPLNFRNGERYVPATDRVEELYGPTIILTGCYQGYKPEWLLEKEEKLYGFHVNAGRPKIPTPDFMTISYPKTADDRFIAKPVVNDEIEVRFG